MMIDDERNSVTFVIILDILSTNYVWIKNKQNYQLKPVIFVVVILVNNLNTLASVVSHLKSCPEHMGFVNEQESPAVADKPARRESMPKIAPIRRPYSVVAENTDLSSFV